MKTFMRNLLLPVIFVLTSPNSFSQTADTCQTYEVRWFESGASIDFEKVCKHRPKSDDRQIISNLFFRNSLPDWGYRIDAVGKNLYRLECFEEGSIRWSEYGISIKELLEIMRCEKFIK